jgi:hypothetical protein
VAKLSIARTGRETHSGGAFETFTITAEVRTVEGVTDRKPVALELRAFDRCKDRLGLERVISVHPAGPGGVVVGAERYQSRDVAVTTESWDVTVSQPTGRGT